MPAKPRAQVAAGAVVAVLSAAFAANAADVADGEKVFAENCAVCHQKGGVGAPGLAPPLVSAHVKAAAAKNPAYAVGIILNGMSGPLPLDGGDSISGIMPPVGLGLSDADVAAVAAYVLNSLNGGQATIDAKTVTDLRSQKHSAKELRAMREELLK